MTSALSVHAPPDEIARELDRDEQLLWIGQPRQGVFLRGPDLFMVPFSLLWGGFAVFWEWQVLHTPNAPAFMALFGLPFVLFGVYLIAGRFFVDARLRARTFYALTDQRVLIVGGLWRRSARSLALQSLPSLALNDQGNGYGTISFGGGWSLASAIWLGLPGLAPAQDAGYLDSVPEPRRVFDLIRSAQKQVRLPR